MISDSASDMERFPVINFSEPNKDLLARHILDACVRWGFMILVNYGVNEDQVQRMFQMVKIFFLTAHKSRILMFLISIESSVACHSRRKGSLG